MAYRKRNWQLRAVHDYLDKKVAESNHLLTAADLDSLVRKELHMDMFVKSARSRMVLLFMAYISLLRRSGLKYVIENSPKISVYHVLSAVKPHLLR